MHGSMTPGDASSRQRVLIFDLDQSPSRYFHRSLDAIELDYDRLGTSHAGLDIDRDRMRTMLPSLAVNT